MNIFVSNRRFDKISEMPQESLQVFCTHIEKDPVSISNEEYCGVSSAIFDRYVEYLITTDKVITGVLKDISFEKLMRISGRELTTKAIEDLSHHRNTM